MVAGCNRKHPISRTLFADASSHPYFHVRPFAPH
jgi:hypothetical protein